MFEWFVRHGTIMAVITLITFVLGVVVAMRIPVQMIPDLEVRTIGVKTSWSGATPQDIEKEILIEQEEYLRSIPSLERIISRASSGSAEIELEFPHNIDLNETLIRINNALSQVPSYPENVDQPRISASSFSSNAFMFFRVSPIDGNPRQLNMDIMRDFIDDNVRARLENVKDVSRVGIFGGAEKQVQILLDPSALAERKLTLNQVRRAISNRNNDRSGGEIDSGKRRYLIRTVGRFDTIEDLKNLIIARHGESIIRLKDVANVSLHHFEIWRKAFVNGESVIGLALRRESGSSVIEIKKAVLEEMKDINANVLKPAGMELELIADDVVYVVDSLQNVWKNLAIGAVFVTIVMFLFMRSLPATLVGVIGIPICTMAAFIGLALAGRTINVISLAGVAFAIGMTLDNSIVVLESIYLERKQGLDRVRAAIEGVKKVWPAVLASTLTTILVFVPIIFISEEAGQLYSDIAIAVSSSILASMLVAIAIIPTAAAHIDFGNPKSAALTKASETSYGPFVKMVHWLVNGTFRRAICILGVAGASFAVIAFLTPAAEYLPEGDEPKVFARMSAPPGYNMGTMENIAQEIRDYLQPYINNDPGKFKRGETDVPAISYYFMWVRSSGITTIAQTVDPADIDAFMKIITNKYRAYPGMRAFATRGSIITSNDGGTRSISLDISGANLQEVYATALAAYRRAGEILDKPRIQADPSTLTLSQPLLEVRPQWDRAAELNMSAQELGFTVAAFTDGAFVGHFFQNDEKIDIYFYSKSGFEAKLETIGQLPVHTPQGTIVPLSALAKVSETVDTNSIRRINAKRTVTLNIIPPANVPLETGVEIVRKDLIDHMRETGQLQQGITMDISGASDQLNATRKSLMGNYVVAVIIIYLLLVAIFTHWGYPFLIITSIPLGVAGGIIGLLLMNWVGAMLPLIGVKPIQQPFDMISMLGFLILMGTVVNNPILIVDRALYNLRTRAISTKEAVMEAVSSRLRPIAMSTITTIFGLAPLVFIPGAGTELYRGVGAIVLFGILATAIVSLTFLPALTITLLQRVEGKEKKSVPRS